MYLSRGHHIPPPSLSSYPNFVPSPSISHFLPLVTSKAKRSEIRFKWRGNSARLGEGERAREREGEREREWERGKRGAQAHFLGMLPPKSRFPWPVMLHLCRTAWVKDLFSVAECCGSNANENSLPPVSTSSYV